MSDGRCKMQDARSASFGTKGAIIWIQDHDCMDIKCGIQPNARKKSHECQIRPFRAGSQGGIIWTEKGIITYWDAVSAIFCVSLRYSIGWYLCIIEVRTMSDEYIYIYIYRCQMSRSAKLGIWKDREGTVISFGILVDYSTEFDLIQPAQGTQRPLGWKRMATRRPRTPHVPNSSDFWITWLASSQELSTTRPGQLRLNAASTRKRWGKSPTWRIKDIQDQTKVNTTTFESYSGLKRRFPRRSPPRAIPSREDGCKIVKTPSRISIKIRDLLKATSRA